VPPTDTLPSPQIYTLGDAAYFLGIVALVNSLRITGNTQPVVVLDLGLEPHQRRLLEGHCRFMDATPIRDTNPWHLFPFPVFDDPRGVIAIVDSDILVTAPLDPYFEAAARGQIVGFPDLDTHRWFGEWTAEFALDAPLRRDQAYVNAGFIAFSTIEHPALLRRWWDCCEAIAGRRTALDDGDVDSPVAYGDQDAMNALLMSVVPPERVAIQPAGGVQFLERELARTRIVDLERLGCEHDGQPVVLLHRIFDGKPWQRASWARIRRTSYLRCLRRALTGPDLAIRVKPSELPVWLRPGARGAASAWALHPVEVLGRVRRRMQRRMRDAA
jgi:hypothetical protein